MNHLILLQMQVSIRYRLQLLTPFGYDTVVQVAHGTERVIPCKMINKIVIV